MLFQKKRPLIQIKTAEEIEGMRRAGKLASQCLEHITKSVEPGMSTQDIDDLQMAFAKKHGATPAPLNYKGFPKSICTSINEVICHGIPDSKVILEEGDIIGVDVTLIVDGFYGDNASTIPVGEISPDAQKLLWHTLESLRRAIDIVKPGKRLGDIGHTIQSYAEKKLGYGVVRDFVGHGIGKHFHEEPQVPHVGKARTGVRLRPNMTFTIEPMINEGTYRLKVLEDDWTAVTLDGKLSAQYEHTIAVTEEGYEIMTVQNDDGSWEPPGRFEIAKPEGIEED
ncbi:MAG: type I methionyl aminopeptidase [Myxococcota bacterium]|nr:type I methionyl aminopeptidase [Myxococcota bacterium]MEC9443052.1 type I methionyl aminopeptidase [Myxococcota bacterium]